MGLHWPTRVMGDGMAGGGGVDGDGVVHDADGGRWHGTSVMMVVLTGCVAMMVKDGDDTAHG